MTRPVLTLTLAICCSYAVSAQKSPKSANNETKALRDSCNTYLAVKDGNVPTSKWDTRDALAAAFCKGFFRGYMSGAAELFTVPDAKGYISHFRILSGTTYDQAIRAFTVALTERPELLAEDAGVVAMASMKASGLAVLDVERDRYVRVADQ